MDASDGGWLLAASLRVEPAARHLHMNFVAALHAKGGLDRSSQVHSGTLGCRVWPPQQLETSPIRNGCLANQFWAHFIVAYTCTSLSSCHAVFSCLAYPLEFKTLGSVVSSIVVRSTSSAVRHLWYEVHQDIYECLDYGFKEYSCQIVILSCLRATLQNLPLAKMALVILNGDTHTLPSTDTVGGALLRWFSLSYQARLRFY
eukprot:4125669-Amphidinium_carterae.2